MDISLPVELLRQIDPACRGCTCRFRQTFEEVDHNLGWGPVVRHHSCGQDTSVLSHIAGLGAPLTGAETCHSLEEPIAVEAVAGGLEQYLGHSCWAVLSRFHGRHFLRAGQYQ